MRAVLLDAAGRQDHQRICFELRRDFRLRQIDEIAARQHRARPARCAASRASAIMSAMRDAVGLGLLDRAQGGVHDRDRDIAVVRGQFVGLAAAAAFGEQFQFGDGTCRFPARSVLRAWRSRSCRAGCRASNLSCSFAGVSQVPKIDLVVHQALGAEHAHGEICRAKSRTSRHSRPCRRQTSAASSTGRRPRRRPATVSRRSSSPRRSRRRDNAARRIDGSRAATAGRPGRGSCTSARSSGVSSSARSLEKFASMKATRPSSPASIASRILRMPAISRALWPTVTVTP